jgi:GH24 family phage-related lysozyme (muramidase)
MPSTLVKWLYANSNPIMYTDPSGNMSISECYALHICKNKHITTIYRYINDTIIKELVCDIPPDYYYELPDKYPVETLSTSNKGYEFIRQEETYPKRGWEKWPYGDLGPRKGTCTIGYGTVLSSPDLDNCDYDHVIAQNIRTVTAKMTGITKPLFDKDGLMNGLSEDDANDLLINHVKEFPEIYIKEYIPGVYLSQNEYDALISYIYNGGNVLALSDHLIAYQTEQVAIEMLGNTYAVYGGQGIKLTALDTRRKQEVELFLNGDYNYRE